eukprot:scaffold16531_cov21-Tisochrysis_lutea.AAC.1
MPAGRNSKFLTIVASVPGAYLKCVVVEDDLIGQVPEAPQLLRHRGVPARWVTADKGVALSGTVCKGVALCPREWHCVQGSDTVCKGAAVCAREWHCVQGSGSTVRKGMALCAREWNCVQGNGIVGKGVALCAREQHCVQRSGTVRKGMAAHVQGVYLEHEYAQQIKAFFHAELLQAIRKHIEFVSVQQCTFCLGGVAAGKRAVG